MMGFREMCGPPHKPKEMREADQLFDKGVQALQSTDPYRYDCYRIPLDPVTKTFDPRWREAGYPWEVERVNPSQIGPVEAKVRYRYQLFQVDVYFGDVWLALPLDVALRDPLAGVVLYAGYDFVSAEERGGTFGLDVSEGPADPTPGHSPSGLNALDFGLTRPPEVHGRTGYLPRYRIVDHPLLGRFSVFWDEGARNGLHAHRAMDQVKQIWGPAASIVGPELETFQPDTWGFLTAVRVDKVAGRGTDPAVSFQIRIPSDADSSSLLLRATLVGPDQKEIATAFAESPHFHEWPGFSREPAEFGGRWVWTSSFRLPDSFVQALSPKGKPCTVRLQLRQGDRSNRSVQVVSGVQVRPFPKNVFCLADPTLPHFGLIRRGANLSAQVHAYENAAAPDSLRIGVPSGFEMPAGSAKRREDGSYEVLIRPGDGFVTQTLRIFAADGSTPTPLLTRRNAFFLSDPHGFWGGGRARTVTAVDFPTSNLPAGQYVALLTWHDAVSNVSSSASTAFTVFEDLATESAETRTRAATSP